MTGFLPADGATTRLHKLNHLLEFCASFPKGCTSTQLIREGLTLGNTSQKILEYITTLVTLGLLTRRAEVYFVEDRNYRSWAEANGYKEQTYTIKCQNCEATYNSILTACPSCKTSTKTNLNEPQDHTHTQDIESIPLKNQDPQQTTTEPNTHIHIPTPRQSRVKAGRKAELRVVELLNQHGEATLGVGQGGKPDVYFSSLNAVYAVEVKSIQHQVHVGADRYKASVVPLSVGQWRALFDEAGEEGHVPLLVVEVKIRGSRRGHLYHFISCQVVEKLIESTEAKNIRVSVHDLSALSFQSVRPGLPIPGGWRL